MKDDEKSNVLDLSRTRPKLGPKPSVISQLLNRTYDGPGQTEPEPVQEQQAASGQDPHEEAGNGPLPGIEELTPLPQPGDPYEAYSRPWARPLLTLCLLLQDGSRRSFPYSGRVGGPDWLDSPKGLMIVLRFSDVVPMEVVLAGRNLDELYDYLCYHKVAWVRALPAGKMMADRALPVVTGIAVRPWKPPEQ